MLGRTLTAAGSIAVLGIGAAAWRWTPQSTRTYGIPNDDEDTHAYVKAIAARDLVMGGFVLWAALADDRPAMEAGLLACVLAPAADYWLAWRRRGTIPQLGIHASGVLGILATYAVLRAGK